MNIIPAPGERALIVGQTGSGKTAFAVWLLPYCNDGVVYDTKIEPKFKALPGAVIVEKFDDIKKAFKKNKDCRFVVLRPSAIETADPDFLDSLLQRHYAELRGHTCYVDEAYQFHNNGRAGPGLVSVLTRGRSRSITTILSSQRPQWLSRFCLTEAQRFYLFTLVDRKDRARFADIIPGLDVSENSAKHFFRYYDFDLESPILFNPIPLDALPDAAQSYTDSDESRLKFI